DFFQCAPTDQHERTAHRVDRAALDLRGTILRERYGGARSASDSSEVREGAERRREGSLCGMVERPVLALEPAPTNPDARVGVHQLQEPIEHAGMHPCVRVERKEVAS